MHLSRILLIINKTKTNFIHVGRCWWFVYSLRVDRQRLRYSVLPEFFSPFLLFVQARFFAFYNRYQRSVSVRTDRLMAMVYQWKRGVVSHPPRSRLNFFYGDFRFCRHENRLNHRSTHDEIYLSECSLPVSGASGALNDKCVDE